MPYGFREGRSRATGDKRSTVRLSDALFRGGWESLSQVMQDVAMGVKHIRNDFKVGKFLGGVQSVQFKENGRRISNKTFLHPCDHSWFESLCIDFDEIQLVELTLLNKSIHGRQSNLVTRNRLTG